MGGDDRKRRSADPSRRESCHAARVQDDCEGCRWAAWFPREPVVDTAKFKEGERNRATVRMRSCVRQCWTELAGIDGMDPTHSGEHGAEPSAVGAHDRRTEMDVAMDSGRQILTSMQSMIAMKSDRLGAYCLQ